MDLCKKEAFGQGFVLGAAYFPHEGSKYSEDGMFDDLLLDLTELNGRYELPVVLLGDFTARTGLVDDSIPSESAHVPDFSFQLGRVRCLLGRRTFILRRILYSAFDEA